MLNIRHKWIPKQLKGGPVGYPEDNFVLDITPIVSTVRDGQRAYVDFLNGNYLSGAINTGWTVLDGITDILSAVGIGEICKGVIAGVKAGRFLKMATPAARRALIKRQAVETGGLLALEHALKLAAKTGIVLSLKELNMVVHLGLQLAKKLFNDAWAYAVEHALTNLLAAALFFRRGATHVGKDAVGSSMINSVQEHYAY